MPLERAIDSLADLQGLDTLATLNGSTKQNTDLVAPGFKQVESSENDDLYWQVGKGQDWHKWIEFAPTARADPDVYLNESAQPGIKDVCFTIFCDPEDEARNDDDDKEDAMAIDENDPSFYYADKPMKSPGGILRRGDHYRQVSLGVNKKVRNSFSPMMWQPSTASTETKHVRFAKIRTELPIRPLSFITQEEKSAVWWSIDEFDRIKNSMVALTQPEEMESLCKTWLANSPAGSKQSSPTNDKPEDKSGWWHKYQHSRRGLEKYIHPDEAPQIVESYLEATRQVLMEQHRQHQCTLWPFSRPSPEAGAKRIAQVYVEYTAWARDLALASAASDADCLACDFDDEKRKSREYFLLKQIYQNDHKVHKIMPQFMSPPGDFQPRGFINYSMMDHPYD